MEKDDIHCRYIILLCPAVYYNYGNLSSVVARIVRVVYVVKVIIIVGTQSTLCIDIAGTSVADYTRLGSSGV